MKSSTKLGQAILRSMQQSGQTLEEVFDAARPQVPMGVRQAELEIWREAVEFAKNQ